MAAMAAEKEAEAQRLLSEAERKGRFTIADIYESDLLDIEKVKNTGKFSRKNLGKSLNKILENPMKTPKKSQKKIH